MERNMLKKALVVGIIFLFIGVSVQPVFAKNTIKTTISETLEDCECQPVSNHNFDRLEKLSIRTEKLLNRAKIFTHIVAILSKNNPEISKDKFVELSNRITTLKEINEKQHPPAICLALDLMIASLFIIAYIYNVMFQKFYDMGFYGLAEMIRQMYNKLSLLLEDIDALWHELGCDEED